MNRRADGRDRSGALRVFVVDDHPIVRRGLRDLLSQERGLSVCGEADSSEAALLGIEETRPDLAVIDLSLPGRGGLETVAEASRRWPELRILVLSMFEELLFAERSLRSGAHGYVRKDAPASELLEAIRAVASGRVHLSSAARERALARMVGRDADDRSPQVTRLSDRELEVYRRIGSGETTREIAAALHISVKTVESHRERIKEKLGLRSASELVTSAVQWRLEQS